MTKRQPVKDGKPPRKKEEEKEEGLWKRKWQMGMWTFNAGGQAGMWRLVVELPDKSRRRLAYRKPVQLEKRSKQ